MIFSYHLIDLKCHSIDDLQIINSITTILGQSANLEVIQSQIKHDCCWLAFVTSTWQTLILINLAIHII